MIQCTSRTVVGRRFWVRLRSQLCAVLSTSSAPNWEKVFLICSALFTAALSHWSRKRPSPNCFLNAGRTILYTCCSIYSWYRALAQNMTQWFCGHTVCSHQCVKGLRCVSSEWINSVALLFFHPLTRSPQNQLLTEIKTCQHIWDSTDTGLVLLKVPTKLHRYNWAPIHVKSISATCWYLRAHVRERKRESETSPLQLVTVRQENTQRAKSPAAAELTLANIS